MLGLIGLSAATIWAFANFRKSSMARRRKEMALSDLSSVIRKTGHLSESILQSGLRQYDVHFRSCDRCQKDLSDWLQRNGSSYAFASMNESSVVVDGDVIRGGLSGYVFGIKDFSPDLTTVKLVGDCHGSAPIVRAGDIPGSIAFSFPVVKLRGDLRSALRNHHGVIAFAEIEVYSGERRSVAFANLEFEKR